MKISVARDKYDRMGEPSEEIIFSPYELKRHTSEKDVFFETVVANRDQSMITMNFNDVKQGLPKWLHLSRGEGPVKINLEILPMEKSKKTNFSLFFEDASYATLLPPKGCNVHHTTDDDVEILTDIRIARRFLPSWAKEKNPPGKVISITEEIPFCEPYTMYGIEVEIQFNET